MGEVLANSDHKMIRCNINCEVDIKENALLVPNYNKGNIIRLKLELQRINCQTVFANKDMEQMCSAFTNILLETESKWIPRVRKRVDITKNPQWMTNSLKHIITKKKSLYAKYKQTKSDNDYSCYIAMKRCCERDKKVET